MKKTQKNIKIRPKRNFKKRENELGNRETMGSVSSCNVNNNGKHMLKKARKYV